MPGRRPPVAVHLSPATPVGHAVIGRRLYLGADRAADEERRTLTGVPDEVMFATKPDLTIALLRDAVAAGVRTQYATADEVYSSCSLRTSCRELGLAYKGTKDYDWAIIAIESDDTPPGPLDLIPVTCPELQHLLAATLLPPPRRDREYVTHWSHWRRHHQTTARRCHRTWNAYADQAA